MEYTLKTISGLDEVYYGDELIGETDAQINGEDFLLVAKNASDHFFSKKVREVFECKYENIDQYNLSMIGFRYGLTKDSILPFRVGDWSYVMFKKSGEVEFWIFPIIGEWSGLFGMVNYFTTLIDCLKTNSDLELDFVESLTDFDADFSIRIKSKFNSQESSFEEVYHDAVSQLLDILRQVETKLKSNQLTNTIIEEFRFPDSIRQACEQYLIYFVQFLNDLGIQANSGLESGANTTLFSVTPKDVNQGLAQIRDALNVYLQLPFVKEFDFDSGDIAFQQLKSNIFHLKSQLALSAAQIQAKDATIENLNLTIYLQKNQLEKENNEKQDSEKIFGGIVEIKKYDSKKGVSIDLPKIVRKLRRRFSNISNSGDTDTNNTRKED